MHVDAARRPRFKSSLQPIINADEGLFLFSEGRQAWLPDPLYAALGRMLDGTNDVDVIFTSLSERYAAEQVFGALEYLKSSGYLAEDSASGARHENAFWEHAGVLPSVARSRLHAATVSTLGIGDFDLGFLENGLRSQGIKIGAADDATSDVAVVVTDDYLRPELASWNVRSLTARKSWLLVRPGGIETMVGPMFVPGQTACWECLAQRLRGHRSLNEYVVRRGGSGAAAGTRPPSIASTVDATVAEAVTAISRWIATGGESVLLDRVVSTNVFTLQRTQHTLVRRPQCPACGSANRESKGEPVRLISRPKAHTSGGGHRAFEPREVLERLERHLSPITGIVSSLAPGERAGTAQRNGHCAAPIFLADHSFAGLSDERFQVEGPRRRSGGKGKSIEQARISALAESLERYSGVFDGTEPRLRATFRELGEAAIHPNLCMSFSDRQYAERDKYDAKTHRLRWVPERFREDATIDWTPLWSLSTDQVRYLPTSSCYYGYRSSDPLFSRADSNGCASGSVLEEAVLQGLLELIERDAVAIWWYNRLRRPAVDLATSKDPYVPLMLQHYRGLQREIWALDITSDIGVPTFAAVSRRVDQAEEDLIYGFGTHLDPSVALSRALTEINQALEAVPAANGPASSRTYRASPDAVNWWRTTTKANTAYLAPDPAVAARHVSDFKDHSSNDLLQDVVTCRGLLAERGIDVLVLDQTRPDVDFSVVRVVAPGLRHFWPRFAPGRLYDVPVSERWISRKLNESELNPCTVEM